MKERDLFPDYTPKTTPDTIHDYWRKPSFIFDILNEIGNPTLENFPKIINYFNEYKEKAEKHPGYFKEGNVILGADENQYYPSEEELLVSEIGKLIKEIVQTYPKEQLKIIKMRKGIKSQKLSFYEIKFRHVDVMGSGRFFYAVKDPKKTEIVL